jgi:hypothetical protein
MAPWLAGGGGRGSSTSSPWVAPGRHAASRGEKEESPVVPAAGVGGWSREEDAGWEIPHATGREREGEGRRISIRWHPPYVAALSFAGVVSAAASTEGASAPAGEVSAAAPRRAPPRWHRRLADDGLKGGLLVVAGGERKRRGREQFMLKVINID